MAFIYCGKCNWSQDDFWTLRYNPITKMWDDIKWLFKPRWFSLEGFIIKDLIKYTGVPTYIKESGWIYKDAALDEYKCHYIHSWLWLLIEVVKELRITKDMKWWTWASWKRNRDSAVCPSCGERCFGID